MMQLHRPNFFIFTGGPGVGKSTLLNALRELGYSCVPEVARMIIQEQNAIHGHALHTGDRVAYYKRMLEQSIYDFISASSNTLHFFDRGIPDLHSYQSQYFGSVENSLNKVIKKYRYNKIVFLFPPWPEIYCHDEERKLPFFEAVETYHSLRSSYQLCGYQTIEVPKTLISERIDFILEHI